MSAAKMVADSTADLPEMSGTKKRKKVVQKKKVKKKKEKESSKKALTCIMFLFMSVCVWDGDGEM
ncbi:hypothetical protein ACF0H5_004588 [Mactra antiquata]